MSTLITPVRGLKGVGPATAAKLDRLGLRSAGHLLSHYPIRHEDLTNITTVAGLRSNAVAVLRGRLTLLKSRRGYRRKKFSITEGLFEDRTGTIRLIWFNQPYIATSFNPGDEVLLVGAISTGKYGPQMQAPLIERIKEQQLLAGRILPIYRSTAGLTQRTIRQLIETLLPLASRIPDWLPNEVRTAQQLIDLPTAVKNIHFPKSQSALERARERLKFNELFLFALSLRQANDLRAGQHAVAIPFDQPTVTAFVKQLPFTLTNGQRRAAWDILQDMSVSQPMQRLLEGDVGSGKTVVAAIAVRNAAACGRQSALLAPTDILASQHYRTFSQFFVPQLHVGLLTASRKVWTLPGTPNKRAMLAALRSGQLDVVVGTHAILGRDIVMPKLSLAIIDEQHRFGVEQRHTLLGKSTSGYPHLLSMTATPIPRTLTLTMYGDLHVAKLTELPPGRKPVHTTVTPPDEQAKVYEQIRQRVAGGEQAYVVCPLVVESDNLGVTAATSEVERLRQEELAGLRLGLLHGKMSGQEKNRILESFSRHELDVLVATPVVEVGVDVPNATIIIIEGAERFGLAQLHQLRGRVGRSAKASFCYLFTENTDPEIRDRLAFVASTTDGFALAEEDLRRRGPGDIYGLRQSGLPEFRMASLTDVALMQRSSDAAKTILKQDPGLVKHDNLARKVHSFFTTVHRE